MAPRGSGPSLCDLAQETLRLVGVTWTPRTVRAARAAGVWGGAWHRLEGAPSARVRRWVHLFLQNGKAGLLLTALAGTPGGFEGRRWINLCRACSASGASSVEAVCQAALRLACADGSSRPHLSFSEDGRKLEVVKIQNTTRVPDLSLMPDVGNLIIQDCRISELPALPGRVTSLFLINLAVERLPARAPDQLALLRVEGNDRLHYVPRTFVDRTAASITFHRNAVLTQLPLMRQRRGRGFVATGARLVLSGNPRLEWLPPSFGGGWRAAELAVTDNPRLGQLPPYFGAGVRSQRVVISANAALVDLAYGFLKRGRCERVKMTENPMLATLPEGMDVITDKMTVADSTRLQNMPADLGRKAGIRHLKVHSNTALRSIWPNRAVFAGFLEVYDNDALRILAPRLTMDGTGGSGGLRVRDNSNLWCLAHTLDGQLNGPLFVYANVSMTALTTGDFNLRGIAGVDVGHNEQLLQLPHGMLAGQTINGDVRITHNQELRSIGTTLRLRAGVLCISANPSLPEVRIGPDACLHSVEVSENLTMDTAVLCGGDRVDGQVLVRANPTMTTLAMGAAEMPSVQLGSMWVIDNSLLRQAFNSDLFCKVAGDLVIMRNLRLRHIAPQEFGFHGHVSGDLVVSENARLRTIHQALIGAARGGLHITENARLKALPFGLKLSLTQKLRIINNAALETLGDVVDVSAYLGIKIVNNRALKAVADSTLRLRSAAGNIRMSFNENLTQLASGPVDVKGGGSCTITHNPRMRQLTPLAFSCTTQRDLYLEYNGALETLGRTCIKAGRDLVLQRNDRLGHDVDDHEWRRNGEAAKLEVEQGRYALSREAWSWVE